MTTPEPKPPKAPKAKRPATRPARRLRVKLEALAAAPGTPEEGEAARAKLDRLNARYDWTTNKEDTEGIFAGRFIPAPHLRLVIRLADWGLASHVKWAIEAATLIKCEYQGHDLMAQAAPDTAKKLGGIAETITTGFETLWGQFRNFPTIHAGDRGLFLRGLYDGMMGEQKPAGEPLPARNVVKTGRAKKNSVAYPSGIGLHPYSVAIDLGKQIRFNVPLPEITRELANLKPKQISK